MTATMKKPKVEGTKIEVSEPKLRFKITNTKAVHYPDPLTQTDYHGFKVGDTVIVGTNYNALYEVIEISRQPLATSLLQNWTKRLYNLSKDLNGNPTLIPKDKKLHELFEEYKKKDSFGVNVIKIQTLVRGTNISKRKSIKAIYEPDTVRCVNYRTELHLISVDELITRKSHMVIRADNQAHRATSKANSLRNSLNVLEALKNELDKKKPPVVVPTLPADLPADMAF